MSELERELTALGGALFPPAPDLASAVAGRIEHAAPAPLRARRLSLLAATIAIVLLTTAMAIPVVRHAVLGLVGVQIERVKTLPAASSSCPLGGGGPRVSSVADASQRAGFAVQLPRGDAQPDAVYLGLGRRGGGVTLVYLSGGALRRQAVLSEVKGNLDYIYYKKIASDRHTNVEYLGIRGDTAVLLSGARHVVSYAVSDGRVVSYRTCLAGTTLLWRRAGVLYRLESELPKAELIRIARSVGR